VNRELSDIPQIGQGIVSRLAMLAARATPTSRVYLESVDGVQFPPPGRGRRYWVVSRALCRFFRVALLHDTPAASQRDALALEIKRLSPFKETGSWFHLSAGFASVWLWDQEATRAAGALAGIDVARLRVLPEPALLPPLEAGTRLIEVLDGYEGQHWVNGGLSASRWWPELPDERAWLLFQRGASVSPDALSPIVPEPLRLARTERPWTKARTSGAFDLSRLDMRLVMAGGALVILALYGYQGARYAHARMAVAAQEQEIEKRASAIEPILTARAQALDNLAAIEAFRALDPYPGQLTLMARVAEALPSDGAHLDDWLFDKGRLELSIASDKPIDVVKLVRSLEASGVLADVAAERAGNNNTLRLHASVVAQ